MLPTTGSLPVERGIATLARELETSGVDSLWVSDHIVLPGDSHAHYPFADDGRVTWPMDVPYFDSLIALATAAAVTQRVILGTAVLVLPLRNPVVFAKQAASIDVESRGRLRLGVGAGWLSEEFDAINVPFAARGKRLEEWVAIARSCWTGRPPHHASENYDLPSGILCLPRPIKGTIPVLVGGHSMVALRRAGRIGDGWIGQQSLADLDSVQLAREIESVRAGARDAGRDDTRVRAVLRIVDSGGRAETVAAALPDLAAAGVTEVIVNLDWEDDLGGQVEEISGRGR